MDTNQGGSPVAVGYAFYYDRAGNKTMSVAEHDLTASERYYYDSASRLASFSRGEIDTLPGGELDYTGAVAAQPHTGMAQEQAWDLDGAGNWSQFSDKVDGSMDVDTRSDTSFNEYYEALGESIAHDANGNMSEDGTYEYEWDVFNRLTRVKLAIGGLPDTLNWWPRQILIFLNCPREGGYYVKGLCGSKLHMGFTQQAKAAMSRRKSSRRRSGRSGAQPSPANPPDPRPVFHIERLPSPAGEYTLSLGLEIAGGSQVLIARARRPSGETCELDRKIAASAAQPILCDASLHFGVPPGLDAAVVREILESCRRWVQDDARRA